MNTACMPEPSGEYRKFASLGEGDTDDIIRAILYADSKIGPGTACIAHRFVRSTELETCRAVWEFIKKRITYVRDRTGYEKIKSPAKTWADRFADCKSMALFAASIFLNLGIPYKYRFVSFDDEPEPTHVYLMCGQRLDIVVDPVQKNRFNVEEDYTYKWDKMTRVAYIGETPQQKRSQAPAVAKNPIPTRKERLAGAPKKVKPKPTVNWLDKTSGELRLMLLKDQIDIAKNYYGSEGNHYEMASQLLRDALAHNVHRTARQVLPVSLPDDISFVGNEIIKASRMTKPAGGIQVSKQVEKQVARDMGVDRISGPLDNLNEEYAKRVLFDCLDEYSEWDLRGKTPDDYSLQDLIDNSYERVMMGDDLALKCVTQVELFHIFNDKLEDSSHHILYEHYTGNLNTAPQTVSFKAQRHKGLVDTFAKIAQMDRGNISMWTKNGIMRNNANAGAEPFTPEEQISHLKALGDQDVLTLKEKYSAGNVSGIGEPITILGMTLAKFIGLLITALAAASELVKVLNQKPKGQLLNAFQSVGTPSMSPDTDDFNTGGEASQNQNLIKSAGFPLLLAGLGLFTISK